MTNYLNLFLSLIEAFLNRRIDPVKFQDQYIELWKQCRDANELGWINEKTNEAFDRIFTASDVFCEDDTIRGEFELDSLQFIEEVSRISLDLRPFLENFNDLEISKK